jgi:parallel beta-helix repeat protein
MLAKMQWLWVAVGGIAFAVIAAGVLLSSEVQAYGGATQVNTIGDPYTYPNVGVCCKPKAPRSNGGNGSGSCEKAKDLEACCKKSPDAKGCDKERPSKVYVDCGATYRDTSDDDADDERGSNRDRESDKGSSSARVDFDSLQEAVDAVADGGIVRVRSGFPGGDCRGNVRIEHDVTIEGDADRRGRGEVVVNGCVTIAGRDRPLVIMKDVVILGTTGALRGGDCRRAPSRFNGFDGRLYDEAYNGDRNLSALSVSGATLRGENVTVRSAKRAIDADHSRIELSGSNLAANPQADFAVLFERSEVELDEVSISGGKSGVRARMLDRHQVSFDSVKVMPSRSQTEGASGGDVGLSVELFDEGLPGLPAAGNESFVWSDGEIKGYATGISVDAGVNAKISGLTIAALSHGIVATDYANVLIENNRISGTSRAGIEIARKASGRAASNQVKRNGGRCFCFGSECDDDDEDIDTGRGFKFDGNSCSREGRHWLSLR